MMIMLMMLSNQHAAAVGMGPHAQLTAAVLIMRHVVGGTAAVVVNGLP